MTNDEKAVLYDLDRVGIESRKAEAVELVELRAAVLREKAAVERLSALYFKTVEELRDSEEETRRLREAVNNLDALYASRTADLRSVEDEVEGLEKRLSESKRLYDETIAGRVLAHRALKNILLYTGQQRKKLPAEVRDTLLRFCAEGGVRPSILRDSGIDTTVAE